MIRFISATDRSRSLEVRDSERGDGSVVHLTVNSPWPGRDDALHVDLLLDDDGARDLIAALASARFRARYSSRFS